MCCYSYLGNNKNKKNVHYTTEKNYEVIYSDFNKTKSQEAKQRILTNLKEESLETFILYVFNKNNKKELDDKALDEVIPYIINAQIVAIMNKLGDNPTEEQIKSALKAKFELKKKFSDDFETNFDNIAEKLKSEPNLDFKTPSWLEFFLGFFMDLLRIETAAKINNKIIARAS